MWKSVLDEAREVVWLASVVGGLSAVGVGIAIALAVIWQSPRLCVGRQTRPAATAAWRQVLNPALLARGGPHERLFWLQATCLPLQPNPTRAVSPAAHRRSNPFRIG